MPLRVHVVHYPKSMEHRQRFVQDALRDLDNCDMLEVAHFDGLDDLAIAPEADCMVLVYQHPQIDIGANFFDSIEKVAKLPLPFAAIGDARRGQFYWNVPTADRLAVRLGAKHISLLKHNDGATPLFEEILTKLLEQPIVLKKPDGALNPDDAALASAIGSGQKYPLS